MKSIDEPRGGYRTIQLGHDRKRWQHRLFVDMRSSPRYRSLVKDLEPDDRDGIEQSVVALNLIHKGQACQWAMEYILEDLNGWFDPERVPPTRTRVYRRVVGLSASLNSLSVASYTGFHPQTDRIRTSHHRPGTSMQLSDADWVAFETLAVEATRQAVRDLRGGIESETEFDHLPGGRISAGTESSKAKHIARLALRLAGQAGTRNDRTTESRLLELLEIDPPNGQK